MLPPRGLELSLHSAVQSTIHLPLVLASGVKYGVLELAGCPWSSLLQHSTSPCLRVLAVNGAEGGADADGAADDVAEGDGQQVLHEEGLPRDGGAVHDAERDDELPLHERDTLHERDDELPRREGRG